MGACGAGERRASRGTGGRSANARHVQHREGGHGSEALERCEAVAREVQHLPRDRRGERPPSGGAKAAAAAPPHVSPSRARGLARRQRGGGRARSEGASVSMPASERRSLEERFSSRSDANACGRQAHAPHQRPRASPPTLLQKEAARARALPGRAVGREGGRGGAHPHIHVQRQDVVAVQVDGHHLPWQWAVRAASAADACPRYPPLHTNECERTQDIHTHAHTGARGTCVAWRGGRSARVRVPCRGRGP